MLKLFMLIITEDKGDNNFLKKMIKEISCQSLRCWFEFFIQD